ATVGCEVASSRGRAHRPRRESRSHHEVRALHEGGDPMANIKSAMKRIRQNEKRRLRNAAVRSTVRTSVKSARSAIEGGQADQARAALLNTIQTLDKA